MPSAKTRISAFLPTQRVQELKHAAEQKDTTFSALLEEALDLWHEKKLEADAKFLSTLQYDDLPTEDEWNDVQSETLKNL